MFVFFLIKVFFILFFCFAAVSQSCPVHLLGSRHLVPCRGAVEQGEEEWAAVNDSSEAGTQL